PFSMHQQPDPIPASCPAPSRSPSANRNPESPPNKQTRSPVEYRLCPPPRADLARILSAPSPGSDRPATCDRNLWFEQTIGAADTADYLRASSEALVCDSLPFSCEPAQRLFADTRRPDSGSLSSVSRLATPSLRSYLHLA